MQKIFVNNFSEINLYKKNSKKSEIVTQMIHGESFSVLKRTPKWLEIKIKEDGYKGFITNKKYSIYIKPTHKVSVLKANLFKKANKGKKIGQLTFGSKIKAEKKKFEFIKFNNKWIENKNIKLIKFKNKDFFKDVKIFKNIKYKWGGKTFKGLDCSALIQIFLNFNNKYCPRDTGQQVKFFKKNISLKNIKKNDVIYWKGHVALALSNKKLIHTYGPRKKTVIMNIKETIKLIKNTANLEVVSIKRI